MNFLKKSIFLVLLITLSACSTKKEVLFLQGSNTVDINNLQLEDLQIQSNDILSILVSTLSPETTVLYNPSASTGVAVSSSDMLKYQGYLVNNIGEIVFPMLGNISVIGKSTYEIEQLIYNLLLDNGQLTGHTVKVRLLNARITIIGDVKRPGNYTYFENNINIFQAIGLAGGLEITADRKNVKIIRESNLQRQVFDVDLTSNNLLSSESYILSNNDILIINPNTTKVKNAGIIGNSGTLVSLLSFILTSIIVINN